MTKYILLLLLSKPGNLVSATLGSDSTISWIKDAVPHASQPGWAEAQRRRRPATAPEPASVATSDVLQIRPGTSSRSHRRAKSASILATQLGKEYRTFHSSLEDMRIVSENLRESLEEMEAHWEAEEGRPPTASESKIVKSRRKSTVAQSDSTEFVKKPAHWARRTDTFGTSQMPRRREPRCISEGLAAQHEFGHAARYHPHGADHAQHPSPFSLDGTFFRSDRLEWRKKTAAKSSSVPRRLGLPMKLDQ